MDGGLGSSSMAASIAVITASVSCSEGSKLKPILTGSNITSSCHTHLKYVVEQRMKSVGVQFQWSIAISVATYMCLMVN